MQIPGRALPPLTQSSDPDLCGDDITLAQWTAKKPLQGPASRAWKKWPVRKLQEIRPRVCWIRLYPGTCLREALGCNMAKGSHWSLYFTGAVPRCNRSVNPLASLGHPGGRVILGYTLNTLRHVITKKSHNVLSKCMVLGWATFTAILGHTWPEGCGSAAGAWC